MTSYNELNNNLETLNLLRMKELLPNTIEKSIKTNISLQESLLELTRAEIAQGITNLFGTSEKADLSEYKDISIDDWYYDPETKSFKLK